MKHRYGKFALTRTFIEHFGAQEVVSEIMSKVLVLRADYSFIDDTIRYEAWSKYFAELEEGAAAPEYLISVDAAKGIYFERFSGWGLK